MEAVAEQFVPQPVPLTGGRGEKLLRSRPPLGERGLEPPLILRRRGRWPDLLANQQPESSGRGVEIVARHRVDVARPLGARPDPAGVGQRLEMPAHRRLRQLHDAAELGH
jgi:hypothetical protein